VQLRSGPARVGLERRLVAVFVSTALLLGLSLLTRPISHDEGQYVGAIALMRSGLPYRDFAYLQTPLQPLLLAPLSFLSAGWLLVGARVANALFGWLRHGLRSPPSSHLPAPTYFFSGVRSRGTMRCP
jgi:hypothetical protein